MPRFFALLVVVAAAGAVTAAAAAERFPILQPEQMNAEQKKLLDALLAGPRGGGDASPERCRRCCAAGRSMLDAQPRLGNRLQNVGAYIRYKTSLPLKLNEFAILITAREWNSQYEWYAHYPLAMKAGLDAKLADELALGKRPFGMKDDEAAVYDFCIELHRTRNVDDAAFNRALACSASRVWSISIGVSGYYTAVSMTLNVARVIRRTMCRCRSSRSTAREASERAARMTSPSPCVRGEGRDEGAFRRGQNCGGAPSPPRFARRPTARWER